MARIYERPGFLLRRCHQISVSIFLDECADLNLTATQFGILYCISHNPGIDQIAIARMLGLDRSTTATVIDRLATRKLLNREVHSSDRRRRSLTLTTEGARVLRSEEHTSELQSLMRISYAVFC